MALSGAALELAAQAALAVPFDVERGLVPDEVEELRERRQLGLATERCLAETGQALVRPETDKDPVGSLRRANHQRLHRRDAKLSAAGHRLEHARRERGQRNERRSADRGTE